MIFALFFALGLTLLVFCLGAVVLQGLRNIPADPPHIGLRTWFGSREHGTVVKEGYHFFLFYPYVSGVILIPVRNVNYDLPIQGPAAASA